MERVRLGARVDSERCVQLSQRRPNRPQQASRSPSHRDVRHTVAVTASARCAAAGGRTDGDQEQTKILPVEYAIGLDRSSTPKSHIGASGQLQLRGYSKTALSSPHQMLRGRDRVPAKPNYNFQRSERNRLKQEKKDAKQRERKEVADRRKTETDQTEGPIELAEQSNDG
jgi:hypothetical protein